VSDDVNGESSLERKLRAALVETLGRAEGCYDAWGASPPSQKLLEAPARTRWLSMPGLSWAGASRIAAAALVIGGLAVLASGFVRFSTPALPLPQSSCAGCVGSAVWATAAFDEEHVIAVGGTDDDRGSLMLLRSQNGGKEWAVERPNAPALTSIAIAGDRLYGSSYCLPTYPPEYDLPSDADVKFGSGVDHSFYPAAASCLYYSDDRGLTWHDTGAGRLVDPSFADAMNGWAHAPYDALGKTATSLYSTTDGGRTWHAEQSPCDAATPWIQQAIATGPGAGYVLCIGSTNHTAEPQKEADWELVQVRPGAAPAVRLGSRIAGLPANTGAGGFFIRADGTGWVYTDTYGPGLASDGTWAWATALYRTTDGGQSWTQVGDANNDWPGVGVRGVSFVSPAMGFAAFRSSGARSGVEMTTDGGLTWHVLAAWDWWSFEPIPAPSQSPSPH
jgi:photosystem II stability/assembly factor-like uncharacterized protein